MPNEVVVFDIKDGVLVRKMLELFRDNFPFTLQEISDETGIPYKTVERRVHRMKKLGLISNRRLGRRWLWDLSTLDEQVDTTKTRAYAVRPTKKPRHLRVVPPQTPPQSTSQSLEKTSTHTRETTQSASQNTPQIPPQFSIDTEDTYMSNTKYKCTRLSPFANERETSKEEKPPCSREEKIMATVVGPDSNFKGRLEEVLNMPREKKKKLDTSNSTPQARLLQRKKEKTEADYNVTDIRLLYEELWCSAKWKGFAPRWTMKDKKHIRDLLDEQGGENTVLYFRYVVKEWRSLQRKYRIQGAPNAAILWGFRSSLLHEALNQTHSSPTLEYSGDENITGDGRF